MLFLSASTSAAENGDYVRRNRAVVYWLFTCCAMVFAMVVLGGVTRLTGSGLSMVDWRPIMGTIPPLTEADWLEVFKQYQQFPEYQYVNEGMTLSGFKFIFFFEYAHRVLGRAIGLVFFFPMVFFWWRGDLPRALKPHVVFMFVLGGLQGLLGWYMVKSGLVDDPHVSQYRLTAHLSLAVAIFAYMFYVALELQRNRPLEFMRSNAGTRYMPSVLVGLVALMIVIGGFVAGTRAGFIFNTWPDMNGAWVPTGIWALNPFWVNLFENPVTIQFVHRVVAYILLVLVVVNRLTQSGQRSTRITRSANLLLVLVFIQAVIGILTLIYQVPVFLGALHQGGALVVLCAALLHLHRSRHPEPEGSPV